ncbi:ABC transporter ATP-binding protein [candidate division KSB1 bacterium]|nr:ABC transporter ATP-binding protein [candidate division KSB1 bacterium]
MEIEIQRLGKTYNNTYKALNDVNLKIKNGMFGLLGPNGAGKTTLMRILVTLLEPSNGDVLVDKKDLQQHRGEIRSMIGYLPQDFSVFAKLSTWEFLDYAAALAGMKSRSERTSAVDKMLEQVNLFDARDRKCNKLSGGMKRRLGIAQALIGHPQIIIVDEPTVGLDPEERLRFRNLLADLSQQDIIIVLSTHIVGDISSTCHDMALLDKGSIVFNGAPEDLISKAKGHVWRISASESELEAIKEAYPVISTIPSENGYDVQVVGESLTGFSGDTIEPNLEDAYVYFMEVHQKEAI